jgi:hypothetical protein
VVSDVKDPQPPVVPRDKDGPFLLISKDGQKREYKHFAEVLPSLEDGDKIEVYGNGPFQLPTFNLDKKGLDLRAAPGYRPCSSRSATLA